jgi:pyrophosphatase PpaX
MTDRALKLRAVLFDFDGTLVNTTPLILRCFRATCEQVFGFACEDAAYIQTFGIPLQTAMAQMIERLTVEGRIAAMADPLAKAEELTGTYRAFNERWHDEMIQPIAGVDEMLQELKQRGFRLGLVTSKKRAGAERGMRLYGMAELFDLSICVEDTRNNKPHPEPLLRAMEILDTRPGETIYVGDSTHDIVAGRAAGVLTAAAAWGPFPRAELAALQPDYLLNAPRDLLSLERLA